jgi:hypothetical protein
MAIISWILSAFNPETFVGPSGVWDDLGRSLMAFLFVTIMYFLEVLARLKRSRPFALSS